MHKPTHQSLAKYIEDTCKRSSRVKGTRVEKLKRLLEKTFEPMRTFYGVLLREFRTIVHDTNAIFGWLDLDTIRETATKECNQIATLTQKILTGWTRRFVDECNRNDGLDSLHNRTQVRKEELKIIQRRHSKIRALEYTSKQQLIRAIFTLEKVVSSIDKHATHLRLTVSTLSLLWKNHLA